MVSDNGSNSCPASDSESYSGSDTLYVPDSSHVSSVTCVLWTFLN